MALYELILEDKKVIYCRYAFSAKREKRLPEGSLQFRVKDKLFALSPPRYFFTWFDKSGWTLREATLLMTSNDPDNNKELRRYFSHKQFGCTEKEFDSWVDKISEPSENLLQEVKSAIVTNKLPSYHHEKLSQVYVTPQDFALWLYTMNTLFCRSPQIMIQAQKLKVKEYINKEEWSRVEGIYKIWKYPKKIIEQRLAELKKESKKTKRQSEKEHEKKHREFQQEFNKRQDKNPDYKRKTLIRIMIKQLHPTTYKDIKTKKQYSFDYLDKLAKKVDKRPIEARGGRPRKEGNK